jgi:hypothetical protein
MKKLKYSTAYYLEFASSRKSEGYRGKKMLNATNPSLNK